MLSELPMSPDPASIPRKAPRRGLAIGGIVGCLALGLIVANGIWSRSSSQVQLKALAIATATPTVAVVAPDPAANKSSLDLPGRLEAYSRAPIYARVGGFLKAWDGDIGAPVKAGQLLAEIEAPDLDQQLLQARAALASARAAEALALVTAQRWQTLGGTNTVAKQTVDEKTGDLTVKQALSKAAQANVDRLTGLADFKRVVAPFDGTVTTRNTDLAALINADSSAGLPLFVISDTRKLRLTVSVPQNDVPAAKINNKVHIMVAGYPAQTYTAVSVPSARSVDAASGTTRMQVVVDNSAGELMPGAFANPRIALPQDMVALTIPAGALIFRQKSLRGAFGGTGKKVVTKARASRRDLGPGGEL